MAKVESGYTIGRNDQGVVIKTFGRIPPKKILGHLESMRADPQLKDLPFSELRSSIIEACTRLGVILESGGIISADGKLAMPLANNPIAWPHFSEKHVRIQPEFLSKLSFEYRTGESGSIPFFFLRGDQGRKVLLIREFPAMVNLVNSVYEGHGNPYPRVSATSIVEQVLLSSIAANKINRA